MGRARPKGENEGRGKTSGATPGIPFAFVRPAFSLSLSRASFLSLSLSPRSILFPSSSTLTVSSLAYARYTLASPLDPTLISTGTGS